MNLTSFVAFRYLVATQANRFFSWISMLCITGFAIGVAAMIVVLSVINGFQDELRNRFLSANAHIMAYSFPAGIRDPEKWQEAITTEYGDHITGVAPFVHCETMGRKDYLIHAMLIRGVSPELRKKVQNFNNIIRPPGAADKLQDEIDNAALGKPLPEIPSIILGKGLASLMQVEIGELVELIAPRGDPEQLMEDMQKFRLAGIYESGLQSYDDKLGLLSIPAAQELFGLGDLVTGIEIGLKEPDRSKEIASLMSGRFSISIKEWQSFNKNIFEAMQTEKKVIALIVALVAFVASFNILTTLFVSVTQKRRDIAILKALGTSNKQILSIFIKQAAFIGLSGGLCGVVLAFALAKSLEHIPFIRLPDIYLLSNLPVSYDWKVYLGVTAAGLIIAVFAGLYPACRATRVLPVQGLSGTEKS